MIKTSKFFVLFGSLVGIVFGIYLILNLGLEVLVGLTYIPFLYYIIYGVGSLVAISAATFVAKRFSGKLIGLWAIATAILAIIASCFYNWNSLLRVFLKVLPVEFILGFVVCFIVVCVSGILSKVSLKKKKNSENISNTSNQKAKEG